MLARTSQEKIGQKVYKIFFSAKTKFCLVRKECLVQYINASSACVYIRSSSSFPPKERRNIVSDEDRDEEECLCAIREMESSVPYFCVIPAFSHPLCHREFYKCLFPSFFLEKSIAFLNQHI